MRGPEVTVEVQLKPPPEWTKLVDALNAPPPVSATAPGGNPLMSLALNPNPVFGLAANAADDPSVSMTTPAANAIARGRASDEIRYMADSFGSGGHTGQPVSNGR